MREAPRRITLHEWDQRYAELCAGGLAEPAYGGPLRRHLEDGDLRLQRLRFDNSPAALRLWNFLLTEEDRLAGARRQGKKIVGVMKDLGTTAVMAYALPELVAFYPDGAFWIPSVMELSAGLLRVADSLGIDESFCPVRAMLGAFVTGNHFPIPDLLVSSAGATCDDFSAIAQRLESLGHPILWWEIPSRRRPEADESVVELPGGFQAPAAQVDIVRSELRRVQAALEEIAGERLDDERLSENIRIANEARRKLRELRQLAYTADPCPLSSLEMLIAEMLAIHFCSDRTETIAIFDGLLDEVRARVEARQGTLLEGAPRIFWVNPVADLRAMDLFEECGGRVCGTEYLFCHALDEIPEDLPPLEALARMALADPMVGPAHDRAERVVSDMRASGAEALLVSRIPGASHCATEGEVLAAVVQERLKLPVVQIEVPPVCDPLESNLRTRMEALVETVQKRRKG